jgi:tetratricopeptide (TPR) repeat protein
VSTACFPVQAKTLAGGFSQRTFLFVLLLFVGGAITRSAIATRLDDFTIDEAYHIAAGASYVQRADFRLNPEHPPLVKLWVGVLMSATGFHLSPFRQFHDKGDERNFAEEDVFLHNNPDSVQRRSRLAMWALNGLLMVMLGLTVRRAFSPAVALGTVLFLAIDPTVAAHLPVVMTDLPVALLSAATVVLATRAFREWQWLDLILCSLALGFTLGAKHSGIVCWVFLALTGCVLAVFSPGGQAHHSRIRRLLKVSAVLIGALVILWSLYFFRFHESRSADETFNRPLKSKITDLNSRFYDLALGGMNATHVLPRPYIWGLADTIRGGVEGRPKSRLAFGRLYYKKAPKYFFSGVIGVKLPIGLILLVLFGIALWVARRLPRDWNMPAAMVLAALAWFLFVLSFGSTYAGIRHALPAVLLLSIMGGLSITALLWSRSKPLKITVAMALLSAAASALPVARPWEYYNEFIGGKDKAYLLFNDEGVDLGQRGKELIRYYRTVLLPSGELPYFGYSLPFAEAKARGFDCVGLDPKRDETLLASPVWSGTIMIEASALGKRLWWDVGSLRAATPVARFGNVMIYKGVFAVPSAQAETLYYLALQKLYSEKPDLETAERLLKQSIGVDSSAFFVNVELGNVYLKNGSRQDALTAYKSAFERAPNDAALRDSIQEQIDQVSTKALEQVAPLRNPDLE